MENAGTKDTPFVNIGSDRYTRGGGFRVCHFHYYGILSNHEFQRGAKFSLI